MAPRTIVEEYPTYKLVFVGPEHSDKNSFFQRIKDRMDRVPSAAGFSQSSEGAQVYTLTTKDQGQDLNLEIWKYDDYSASEVSHWQGAHGFLIFDSESPYSWIRSEIIKGLYPYAKIVSLPGGRIAGMNLLGQFVSGL